MEPKRISVWADLAIVALIFVGATLAGALCLIELTTFVPSLPEGARLLIVYSVQFVLAITGAGIYYRWRDRDKGKVFRTPLKWFSAPMTVLGVVLTVALSVVLEPLLNLFPERYFEEMGTAIGSGVWAILLSVVAAPIFEEIFFRGLVLEHALRRWPAWQAVAVTSLLFGLVHLPNPPQMVNAAVVGVMMGYIYVRTRSLTSVIAIHAVNNAIAYLFLETTGTQHTDLRQIIANDAIYWIVFGVSALVLLVAIVPMAIRAENNNKITSDE
jgi:membrane protease YdiL (CAAX protease family)